MRTSHRTSFLFAAVVAGLTLSAPSLPVLAQPAAPAAPAVASDAEIARVEEYLNGIRTLKSDFVQVSSDGAAAEGTFYLSRPGRMRIEYDPPVENFIVADGRFVYFWDAEMREQSNAPIGSTLADFLLRGDIRLSGDVTVTDVQRDGNLLEVSLVQTKDPGLGQLTLVFEDQPLRLRKWRVLDATGQMTEVALQNPQQGVELDRNLFFFRDPTRRQERD
ncbi:LolA family protein [Indioceanicola profundi]|uniref:LolA family protein n=1 Tax=Indioceanicola profundi TaxID=2220096 RepID=UPI000E6AC129|nr:outer membrane lipoprotein carrier protein LolA [Indioceanicola profundi]